MQRYISLSELGPTNTARTCREPSLAGLYNTTKDGRSVRVNRYVKEIREAKGIIESSPLRAAAPNGELSPTTAARCDDPVSSGPGPDDAPDSFGMSPAKGEAKGGSGLVRNIVLLGITPIF